MRGVDDRNKALGLFLRACREEVTPADVGLVYHGRRLVRGLRREEVAQLAGISHTWYTNLEQGRDVNPSCEVIDAIARALRLGADGTDHLHRLAGHPAESRSVIPRDASVIRSFVDSLNPVPVAITTAWLDYVAVNAAYEHFLNINVEDWPSEHRNVLWILFEERSLEHIENLASLRSSLVEQLRFEAAEYGSEPHFARVVSALQDKSEEFRTLWARHRHVRRSMYEASVVRGRHPQVGLIQTRPLQLSFLADATLRASVQVPVSAIDGQRLQALGESLSRGDAAEGETPNSVGASVGPRDRQ